MIQNTSAGLVETGEFFCLKIKQKPQRSFNGLVDYCYGPHFFQIICNFLTPLSLLSPASLSWMAGPAVFLDLTIFNNRLDSLISSR